MAFTSQVGSKHKFGLLDIWKKNVNHLTLQPGSWVVDTPPFLNFLLLDIPRWYLSHPIWLFIPVLVFPQQFARIHDLGELHFPNLGSEVVMVVSIYIYSLIYSYHCWHHYLSHDIPSNVWQQLTTYLYHHHNISSRYNNMDWWRVNRFCSGPLAAAWHDAHLALARLDDARTVGTW